MKTKLSTSVWCSSAENDDGKKMQRDCLGGYMPGSLFFFAAKPGCQMPRRKLSSTWGSSLSLFSVRENFPLNRDQSYRRARSYMA